MRMAKLVCRRVDDKVGVQFACVAGAAVAGLRHGLDDMTAMGEAN